MLLRYKSSEQPHYRRASQDSPNNRRPVDGFTILVNSLQDVGRLRLLLGFERRVQVDLDLLGLEV